MVLHTVSPIKGKFHMVKGYTVKTVNPDWTSTVVGTFMVDNSCSVDMAYENATMLATLLNNAQE